MILFHLAPPFALAVRARSQPQTRRVTWEVVCEAGSRARASAPGAESVLFATANLARAVARACAKHGMRDRLSLVAPCDTERVLRRLGVSRLGYHRPTASAFVPLTTRLARLDGARSLRLAVVSPYAGALGDSLLFLTMLRELRRTLRASARGAVIDVFHDPVDEDHLWMYSTSRLVDRLRALPQPIQTLARDYDAYFDFSGRHIPSDRPWIDGLLDAAGMCAEDVPAARKRNAIALDPAADRDVCAALSSFAGRRLLLFNANAGSGIRAMPRPHASRLIDAVVSGTDFTLLTTSRFDLADERVAYIPELFQTFRHFVSTIAASDAFITVDTCLFHIADALRVPGVVLFTTNRPSQWLRYYPRITGIQMAPGNGLEGLHFSEAPDHLDCAARLWDELDVHQVLAHLARATNEAGGRTVAFHVLHGET